MLILRESMLECGPTIGVTGLAGILINAAARRQADSFVMFAWNLCGGES